MTTEEQEFISLVRQRPDLMGEILKLLLSLKQYGVPPQGETEKVPTK